MTFPVPFFRGKDTSRILFPCGNDSALFPRELSSEIFRRNDNCASNDETSLPEKDAKKGGENSRPFYSGEEQGPPVMVIILLPT